MTVGLKSSAVSVRGIPFRAKSAWVTLAAGIRPGDPSLFPETVEDVDPYGPPS